MDKQTFKINCSVFCFDGKEYKGTVKVNNCYTELQAKIKLEVEMKKRYPSFMRMVIHSCVLDVPNVFKDIFGDIFK